MGIRESLLNTITSVGNGDFVRIVTSAGASSKATLQNVIKSFETGLGSKSSLADSDYIRIVGSDNNLYKQSVNDVEKRIIEDYTTSLNGRTQSVKTAIERTSLYCHSPSYIDNTTTIYAYVKAQYNSGKTNGEILEVGCADAPTSSAYRVLWFGVSSDATADITLFAWPNNSPSGGIYMTRFHAVSGSALDPWVHLPTRGEIDALNSKIRDSLIRQYRTGEKSKINIAANGTSSVDGILTRYDGANLSVYAFHAYTPNGSSFSEAAGVDVKTGQAWSELSTSGRDLVLAVGQYKAGLLTLAYTSGHEPTITYV